MSFNAFFYYRRNSRVFRAKALKSLFSLLIVLTVALFLSLPVPAYAQEITYEGYGTGLQDLPAWFSGGKSLFPGTDGAPLSTDNKVVVDYDPLAGGVTHPDYVFGGLSQSDNATNNSVKMLDGRVNASVYGGLGYDNAVNNSVTISNGFVGLDVYGGYSFLGNAEDNTVTISGGWIDNRVSGGDSRGNANNNSVYISGGTIIGYTHGGISSAGNADNNSVTISGGTVLRDVHGGETLAGNADNNSVTFSGGVARYSIGGGYSQNGSAHSNSVTISGGVVSWDVYGGESVSGAADHNSVTISGGTIVNRVYGGYNIGSGANNNSVTISGGTVGVDAYGVITAFPLAVYGGYSMDGSANNNSVTISGGELAGDIYGGYLDGFYSPVNYNDAINNSVTISGSPTLANSYIYGGYCDTTYATQGGDTFSGNTLNFKSSNITVAGVANFEYYNFYLPTGTAANETMLSVTDSVDLTDAKAEILVQGKTSLKVGDAVALINSASGVSNYAASSNRASLGALLTYDFDVYSDTNNLWAELTSVKTSPSTKALTNSRAAPLAFLNQGADMAALLEHLDVSGDKRPTAFALFGGGSSTYDTGSDVDIDSFSLLAGVTWNAPVRKNSLALSAFIEAGWGSYDTYNDFGGGNVVRGDGDTDYYGVGLHMRYTWNGAAPGGLYAEGALRFGRMSTDFNSGDMISGTGYSYDSDSNYYGISAGLGYVWQLSGKTRLDVSGKYIWTHLDSDEFTASNGDEISFDSANSHRFRAGFRFYRDCGNANAVTLYYGAAYEYEFDGDADGRVYGTYALDGSSLSGSTGIGELGVTFRPSKDNDRLMMQLGIQGYVGVREGVSGTLKLQYAF